MDLPQGTLDLLILQVVAAADWKDTETGREAKFYRLTRKGRAQLETETESWRRLAKAVGLILRMSEGGAE